MRNKIQSRINREQLILYRTYKGRSTQIKYTSYIHIYIYIYIYIYMCIYIYMKAMYPPRDD